MAKSANQKRFIALRALGWPLKVLEDILGVNRETLHKWVIEFDGPICRNLQRLRKQPLSALLEAPAFELDLKSLDLEMPNLDFEMPEFNEKAPEMLEHPRS